MFSALAAAKRTSRGRGRLNVRGRGRSRGAPDDSPPLNGTSGASPSFVLASTSPTPSSRDEERRQMLLRRLNEITHQKQRLERRQQRFISNDSPIELGTSMSNLNRNAASLDARGGCDDMSVDYPSYAGDENVDGDTNGSHAKHALSSKRRRGEASDEAIAVIGSPSGQSDADFHNGRHTAPRIKSMSYSGPIHPPPPIDLDAMQDRSSVSNLEAFAGNRSRGKSLKKNSPQPSPTISTRGSGRVRTPSVLLSSQPGEKPQPDQASSPKNRQVAYCLRLVKEMLRLKDGYAFSRPIEQLWSVDHLPGYFDMIKRPMDLGTIRERLEGGYYMSTSGKEVVDESTFDVEAFKTDSRLVFQNARTYNRPGDLYFSAATRLLEKFESRMAKMPSAEDFAQHALKKSKKRKKGGGGDNTAPAGGTTKKSSAPKKRKVARASSLEENGQETKHAIGKKKPPASGTPRTKSSGNGTGAIGAKKKKTSKPEPSPRDSIKLSVEDMEVRLRALKRQREMMKSGSPASPPASGASYLAQAQALYHVEMTFQEKVQLSNNVGLLPADKLQKIVALATKNKAGSMEVNHNQEIELDIDSMNNETLRDMEAYVNQILSKGKGKKGRAVLPSPNADIVQMTLIQVTEEIEKLTATLRKESKGTSKELGEDRDGSGCEGRREGRKPKSFYDSDSSSESDDSDGSGSDDSSDDDSSSSSSDSTDESGGDSAKKRRERNLAHQQAMQVGHTPLQSPPYSQPSQ